MATKQVTFADSNGHELIIEHRKSAVFFKCLVDLTVKNRYIYPGNPRNKDHEQYICDSELSRSYEFTDEQFKEFCLYCEKIANEAWSNFVPKAVDSFGADYDDYYDKEFDNNGRLSIRTNTMHITGPYTQLVEKGPIVRLIKFNKRKFESFVYDLKKRVDAQKEESHAETI